MTENDLKLVELLKVYIDEEHHFLVEHQKRIGFYTSIITAVLAATIAGAINASQPEHFLLLKVGPIIVLGVAWIARDGTFRLYQRFLEALTARAKVEQCLGMTDVPANPAASSAYWAGEGIVPTRHLRAREQSATSAEFVDRHRAGGYHSVTTRLLMLFQAIAILVATALGWLWYAQV